MRARRATSSSRVAAKPRAADSSSAASRMAARRFSRRAIRASCAGAPLPRRAAVRFLLGFETMPVHPTMTAWSVIDIRAQVCRRKSPGRERNERKNWDTAPAAPAAFPAAGAAGAVSQFFRSFRSRPGDLRRQTCARISMTDQAVIVGCTGMVSNPRRKRTAARRGKGAPAQDARMARREKRRAAILDAALEESAARGFAATRLDDVARRARIAKGTIYLYFRDKESLFQELVRTMLSPLVGTIEAAPLRDLPIRAVAEMIVDVFVNEIYATRRKDVIRLIIAEGPRFPKLAEVYYREVITRVLPVIRARLALAVERGELSRDALARFPQLLVAPALVAIVWNRLFGRFAPLEVRELMRAHLDLLFGERSTT